MIGCQRLSEARATSGFARIFLIAAFSGERLLTERKPAAQPWRRQLTFMPMTVRGFKEDTRRDYVRSPAWEGLPFVTMEPVVIRARDGLELVCYLSRPRDSQPTERQPMVLLVSEPWLLWIVVA
jgi:dipeptidyl aminopeptidase/acylaminoacyl peptidase